MILPLSFDGVCFDAGGQRLLADLTFSLEAGRTTFLLGPNGAGKTLTLRVAHGLLAPTRGSVTWNATAPALRQAMVFQRPVLLRRTALANVEYGLALRGVGRAERRKQAMAALERTGLAALADRGARLLSAGEQQRLALARAWALEPEIWFLDEPTASLDPAATHAVEGILQAIRKTDAKIVMTTHDLGQARRLADEILFLHHGCLVERADAAAFFARPQHEAARAFVAGELLW